MNLDELILSELGIGKPKAVSLADIATRTDLALYAERVLKLRGDGNG